MKSQIIQVCMLLRKKELVALLKVSAWCIVTVNALRVFRTVPLVGM